MLVRDTEIGGTQVMNFDDGPSVEMTNTNLKPSKTTKKLIIPSDSSIGFDGRSTMPPL